MGSRDHPSQLVLNRCEPLDIPLPLLSLSRDTNHEKILKADTWRIFEDIYIYIFAWVCVYVYYEVQSFFDNSIEGYYLFFANY